MNVASPNGTRSPFIRALVLLFSHLLTFGKFRGRSFSRKLFPIITTTPDPFSGHFLIALSIPCMCLDAWGVFESRNYFYSWIDISHAWYMREVFNRILVYLMSKETVKSFTDCQSINKCRSSCIPEPMFSWAVP